MRIYTENELIQAQKKQKPLWFEPERLEWSPRGFLFIKWGGRGTVFGRCLDGDLSMFPIQEGKTKSLSSFLLNGTFAVPLDKRENIWHFSIKQCQVDAWRNISVGDIFQASIRSVHQDYLFADLKTKKNEYIGLTAYMKSDDMSESKILNAQYHFEKGDIIPIKIIGKYQEELLLRGSRKEAVPENRNRFKRGQQMSVRLTGYLNSDGWYCEVTPSTKGIINTSRPHSEGDFVTGFVRSASAKGVKLIEI